MGNGNSTPEATSEICCALWKCGCKDSNSSGITDEDSDETDEDRPLLSKGMRRNRSYDSKATDTLTNYPRPSTSSQMEEETMQAEPDDLGFVLSPDAKDLKLDQELMLSHDLTEQLMANIDPSGRVIMTENIKNLPRFPSAYQLLVMAKAAYKDLDTEEPMEDYRNRVILPVGWKLLTIAENRKTSNGYFGVAYVNASCSQVVIAHRGTKFSKVGAVWADVKGVFMNNYVNQMNSACTFAHLVLSAVRAIEKEQTEARFEVFFTGHSLGGWLSQVTTFSVKYLLPVESVFLKKLNTEQECQPHAVVFDSPGCKDMLVKMADTFHVRYGDSPISLDNLDITSYLSAPNRVNCCNSHVGTVFRIYPDLTNLTWKQFYNLESHSSSNILSTFDPETGQARRDQGGKLKIQRVVDWPVISGILKTGEYKDFFEWAMQLNNYNPDTSSKEYEEEIRKRRGYCPIRYQTTDYKENQRNCTVFTHLERQFLEKYQWLRGLPKHFQGRIIFDEENEAIKDYINLKMQCFSVRKQYITCTSAEELEAFIPFVKTLIQLYPNCVQNVTNVLSSIEASKRIYEIESEYYCRNLEKWSFQFTGTDLSDEYETFMKNDDFEVLNVVVKSDHGDITSARIHNFIQRYHRTNLDTYLLIELQNILTINKSVSFTKLLEWDQLGKTLVVIECSNQTTLSNEVTKFFKDIVLVLQSRTDIKLILVTKKDTLTTEMGFCSVSLDDHYSSVEDSGPTWEHLTPETKRKLLSKDVLVFQGQIKPISLETFFGEDINVHWKNVFDSETVAKLVKGDEVVIGPNVVDFNGISSFYVKRSFVDEVNSGETFYNECDFLNIIDENKVHVISDKAGMGKTTVMTNLSFTMKKDRPHLWIIRVNLNDCTIVLRDKLAESNEVNVEHDASSTLLDLMESNAITKLSTIFEQNLLKQALLVKGKVVLFLDGYDEISPDYEEIILDFLRSLIECKLQNLIIATRPHTKANLQHQLQAKNHTMKAFSEEDQKYFLVRFWQHSLRNTNHELDLEKYSKDMIEKLSSDINDDERAFTGIPLQCRLVAELFQDRLIQGDLTLPDELNLVHLYETFVRNKLKIYEIEKCVDTRGNVNAALDRRMADSAMLRYHRQLALKIIVGEERFRTLGLSVLDDDLLEVRALKAGLLLGGGRVPQFIHRTIAEFFVADFFAAHLENYISVKLLVTEVLLRPIYRVVRSFLNSKSKALKSNLFGKHLAEAFLRERESFFDKEHQTAIHLLVWESRVELLRFVLDCCAKDPIIIDTLIPFITERNAKGSSPLYRGFKNVRKDLVRPFFQSLSHCDEKVKRALVLASMFRQTNERMSYLFNIANNEPEFSGVLSDMEAKLPLIPSFLEAAQRGSVKDLRRNLEMAGDDETRYYLLRAYDKSGSFRKATNTALHWAAERGHVKAVKFLIDNGAPVNYGTMKGEHTTCKWAPLNGAVLANNEKIVKMILEKVTALTPSDMSFEIALTTNNAKIYSSLFAKMTGFDLGTTNSLVYPKFHYQNMLLWSLCKDNSRKWENTTFESFKMVKKDKLTDAVVHMLNKKAKVNKPDEEGQYPIHWAVKTNREDVVSLLIEKEAIVNARNKFKQTPLLIASSIATDQMVQLLLSKGADVNAYDEAYSTALHYAAARGSEEVIRTLLTNKANVNAVDQNKQTALHQAAEKGCTKVATALLDNGANIEARTNHQATALHCATVWNHEEMVKLLLARGANVLAIDKTSCAALHYACRKGYVNVTRILIEHGANCNAPDNDNQTPLHYLPTSGDLFLTQLLLEHSADPNATDRRGVRPLHTACQEGHADMVKVLLENGASVNAATDSFLTALHCACIQGHADVVQILVRHGANVNVVGHGGRTALHYAVQLKHMDVMLLLIKSGANCEASDEDNLTPMDIAMQQGSLGFLIFLSFMRLNQ